MFTGAEEAGGAELPGKLPGMVRGGGAELPGMDVRARKAGVLAVGVLNAVVLGVIAAGVELFEADAESLMEKVSIA